MKQLNQKGFTLVEILAVVVIIGILGLVAIPNVLKIIESSKTTTNEILAKDIVTAGKQLYEELDYANTTLYSYNRTGKTGSTVKIESSKVSINLQTLVSNGFLTGSNNPNPTGSNKNSKILLNSKTKEDIGECQITITKIIDPSTYNTSYQIINNSSSNSNCPTTEEYNNALK